jgi:hypothetical protein
LFICAINLTKECKKAVIKGAYAQTKYKINLKVNHILHSNNGNFHKASVIA